MQPRVRESVPPPSSPRIGGVYLPARGCVAHTTLSEAAVAAHWVCPSCGAGFDSDAVCPACIADTLPDALHKGMNAVVAKLLRSDELSGHYRATAQMMASNRGTHE